MLRTCYKCRAVSEPTGTYEPCVFCTEMKPTTSPADKLDANFTKRMSTLYDHKKCVLCHQDFYTFELEARKSATESFLLCKGCDREEICMRCHKTVRVYNLHLNPDTAYKALCKQCVVGGGRP